MVKILHLEDDVADAELVRETLESENITCNVKRVETEPQFRAALQQAEFDLILADYTLPSFDGLSALRITRQQELDLPFIFVSGTLGEEIAIEALKIGATDYVLKTRLSRLAPAVQRALREATERAERKRAEEAIAWSQKQLDRERERLKLVLELTNDIVSNLELQNLLKAIAANIRKIMHCNWVGVTLPDATKELIIYAYDVQNPDSEIRAGDEMATMATKQAFETERPIVTNRLDASCFLPVRRGPTPEEAYRIAVSIGVRSVCDVPLIVRNRVLGVLSLGRSEENSFNTDDVEFLMQAAGQIAIAVENALAYREIEELKNKLAQEKLYLEDEIRGEINFEEIVGQSTCLLNALQQVETVAPTTSTVLILGETGTGKELVARAIHNRSLRKDRTFVKLNCAAIPTGLLESELFGHEKGSFTGAIAQRIGRFELADQGTLFLDEVGDIPLELQSKLLRALQEKEFERLGSSKTKKVDVRLIAATNQDLQRMVSDHQFRSDLYYRLNVFPVRVPALRERPEDIPLLVRHFTQKYALRMNKQIVSIPAHTSKKLQNYHWPGNVRELENFIERSVILTQGEVLNAPLAELTETPFGATVAIESSERDQLLRVLKETRGRIGGPLGAAERLGLKRTTLLARIKKYGINPRQFS
jgi:formate hydrogenlyase transcriptional activator